MLTAALWRLLQFFLLLFVLLLLELTAACLLLLHDGQVSRSSPAHSPLLLHTCLHHLQLSPHQIGDKVREELVDGLQRARDQPNTTGVFSEWDLLQNKVRAQDSR